MNMTSWWGLPFALSVWKCPECGNSSPPLVWEECRPYCEDCGDHDGRRCPECAKEFDHCWGVELLKKANGIKDRQL